MIKLETHCHTKGASPCADGDFTLLAEKYAKDGYGGVVITNHMSEYSYTCLLGNNHKEKIDYYFQSYYTAKEELNKLGLKTFWGIEVRAFYLAGEFAEYIIYGLKEKDLYDNAPLCTLTQKELFEFAEKRGGFMYQAHPFRTGVTCGNPKYLHGAEAFNGNFGHFNYNNLAEEFCKKNNLIQMSGSDYHHDAQPPTAGIFVPENISDETGLKDFIMNNSFDLYKDVLLYESSLKNLKESRK